MVTDAPEYFFAVAQQPDIVNTALFNGVTVSQTIRYFTMNSSVSTRSEAMAEEITSLAGVGGSCSAQVSAISLSGIQWQPPRTHTIVDEVYSSPGVLLAKCTLCALALVSCRSSVLPCTCSGEVAAAFVHSVQVESLPCTCHQVSNDQLHI